MQLFGLTLAQLLLVLGGASALTLALHMLRAHHKRTAVPFLPLWESVLARREGSRLFARITRLLSLLLSLLLMLLLALALGDPRPSADAGGVTYRVVLIDAGVAMQATDVAIDGKPASRMQAAQPWIEKVIAQAGPLRPTLLAQVDHAALPLGPFTTSPSALQRALQGLAPSDLSTDSASAYRFALQALAQREQAEVVFIGAGAVVPPADVAAVLKQRGIALHRIAIGQSGDRVANVAITTLSARRYPLDRNRSELLIGLRNTGEHAEPVELTLLGDGAPLDVRSFELAPGSTEQRIYDDLAFSGTRIEARLVASHARHDLLAADSVGYAVLPERKRMRVLCVTQGNRYLEAALLLDEYFTIDIAAPGRMPALDGYDAVIFDRSSAPAAVPIPALYLAAPTAPGITITGTIARPRFVDIRDKHPVLRHVSLRDVNMASAQQVRAAPEDKALASSADGPLIVAGERAGVPFVALAFDLQQSDLPLRIAWPLLLINTLDWFADERRDLSPSHVLGETVRVALPSSSPSSSPSRRTSVSVAPPVGPAFLAPIASGEALLSPTRVGFYELRPEGHKHTVAVGFDPAAPLDLAAPKSSTQLAELERAPMPDVWMLLVACALALVAFEWLAFHRRWAP